MDYNVGIQVALLGNQLSFKNILAYGNIEEMGKS